MRVSTLVVLSFLGLILLAASMIWLPAPGPGEPLGNVAETKGEPSSGEPSKDDPKLVERASDSASFPQTTPGTPATGSSSSRLKFPEWPKPMLALVATGEQHGYFEPCGCTANQLGGMSRRAGLFEKIQSLGWVTRGIDVGGLSRRTGPQAQLKFETTLEAMRELQYVGLALGPEELKLEAGYLLSQHQTDGEFPVAFLGANLLFFGSRDIGTPLPFTIIDQGGMKVGITSVMSDTIRRSVIPDRPADDAAASDVQWTDPDAALQDVLKQFDAAGVNFRVLLSQSTLEESRVFAKRFPSFDVLITANGFGDGEPQPEMIGPVRMLQVGEKGKMAGVIGLYPNDSETPVRFELVTLSGELFPDSERMTALMKTYQDRLRDGQIVTADGPVGHPSGATFVGASKCGECHTQAFAIWEKTPHAHALESLDPSFQRTGSERLRGINRTFDPECLSCHVTGWEPQEYVRYRSGFVNAEFAANDSEKLLHSLLAGSQCENCHGPGSRHIELIESDNKEAAIKEVKVSLEQSRDQTCLKCHDVDNSPNFKFEEYWEKVKHYGKD
jgi:hypothetical protein